MKKILFALVAVAVATTASAAISGSSHDMRVFTSSTSASACAFCHMPHGASTAAGAPLWARNLTVNADNAYTYYSTAFTATANPTAFKTETKLCLSCHDGTQSVARVLRNNAIGGEKYLVGVDNTTNRITSGVGLVGTNLSDDHPVSIVYTVGNPAGLAATPPAAFPLFGGGAGSGTVECSSCHEAHSEAFNDAGTTDGADAYPTRQFMVRYDGDFCVACHSLK